MLKCAHMGTPPPAPAPRAHAGATTPGRHLHPFLPEPGLCLSGMGGLGQYPRQRPPQWGALAPTAVYRLSLLLSGDPWYALAWQAWVGRAHRTRHRVPGRRRGHPGHGARVRDRPEHGAAVVGRRGGAAAGLLTALPA